jgi:hypothetical protein
VGFSPFEALYGYSPKHFGLGASDATASSELTSWLEDRQVITSLIKQHLARAKLRMKRQADKKRSERKFEVGDNVFLKLQPYVQSSLAPRSNQKLSFKFVGPYEVLAKVGSVAYKIALPASSSVHPVFHVSQLKKMAPGTKVLSSLPSDIDMPRYLIKVLQRRVAPQGLNSVSQVLVQWSGWSPDLATWEDHASIVQRFPNAPAWGQAAFEEPGNVTSLGAEPATGPRRSSRPAKRNPRFDRDVWAV